MCQKINDYIYYNCLMPEGKQNTSTDISNSIAESIFQLKRLASVNGPSVQVNFSPIYKASSTHIQCCETSVSSASYPVFNRDGSYFTPSFVLGVDHTLRNAQTYLNLHTARLIEMSQQKIQLFVPKPSKNNSFCCICKTLFEDYLTHVNVPSHQQLMRASAYCQDISQLCGTFNLPNQQSVSKGRKQKKIRKVGKRKEENVKLNSYLSSTTIYVESEFDNKFQHEGV